MTSNAPSFAEKSSSKKHQSDLFMKTYHHTNAGGSKTNSSPGNQSHYCITENNAEVFITASFQGKLDLQSYLSFRIKFHPVPNVTYIRVLLFPLA